MDNVALMASMSNLEADEFGRWVRPHLQAMARLAGRLAPAGERDDVVQEALARAWTKRSQFRSDRGSAASWLLAITADQAYKAQRRARRRWLWSRSAPVRSVDDSLDLEFAIKKLPPRQRQAVDCFYFADMSLSQTAAVMNCSQGTVKSTLFDARVRIRRILEDEHGRH